MKIINALKTGLLQSLKSWKGVVIIWMFSLLMTSLVALPIKSVFRVGLGDSMITEKLVHGIDIEVFADLGADFRGLGSYFLSGLIMVVLVGFLINSFLAGGLFNYLRESSGAFSSVGFFRFSAKYFWSFLAISIIMSLIALILGILIIGIPILVVSGADVPAEGTLFKTVIIACSAYILVLSFLFLVADYARAWQVAHDKNEFFKAVKFGFRNTFRTFLSSYSMMLSLLIIQLLFGWMVLCLLAGIKPVTEGGIIFLFILSQVLFFIKIMLKAWRYGSVTRMMEFRTAFPDPSVPVSSPFQDQV